MRSISPRPGAAPPRSPRGRRGTRLERTVVADRTYVGTDLELVDKIVVGHRVIDAATGAWVDIGERGIARALGGWTWPRWALAAADFLRGRANRGRRP